MIKPWSEVTQEEFNAEMDAAMQSSMERWLSYTSEAEALGHFWRDFRTLRKTQRKLQRQAKEVWSAVHELAKAQGMTVEQFYEKLTSEEQANLRMIVEECDLT